MVPYAPTGESIVAGAVNPPAAASDRAFDEMRMHLHQESKAWRFTAIGALVVMLTVVGFLLSVGGATGFMISSMSNEDIVGDYFVLSVFAMYSLFIVASFLPIIIVGFIMGRKVMGYYDESARDAANAIKHVDSVGVIVLAGFFSTAALVFIIINFVKFKKHRAEIEASAARRKAAGGVRIDG